MINSRRRIALVPLDSPEQVFGMRPAPSSLLVDLEGTLTGFSPPSHSAAEALTRFDQIATQNGLDVRQVHYVTNANFKDLMTHLPAVSDRIHIRAHKPFFTPPRQILQCGNAVVLGDQYLTDGLLAWRYQFTFGLVRQSTELPPWPRVMLLLGRAVSRLFWRKLERIT